MLVSGKKLAEEVIKKLQKEFKSFQKKVLAVVTAGNDPRISLFIKQKAELAKRLGVELRLYRFSPFWPESKFIQALKKIGASSTNQAVILQLPLPKKFNAAKILSVLPAQKDVDGLTEKSPVLAPAVETVKFILRHERIASAYQRIVIVGLGRLVGQPIFNYFQKKKSRCFVIEKNTPFKARTAMLKRADLIISGAGKPGLLKKSMVKKGAVIIDFGCVVKKGKVFGDAEPSIAQKARLFTPTPGGTGPLLVAMVFANFSRLLKQK